MKLLVPHENAMLSDVCGIRKSDSLLIDCIIEAVPGHSLTVNGVPAVEMGSGRYTVPVTLDAYRNVLAVCDETSGETAEQILFWVSKATYMYRLSLDDNIWWVQDAARHDYKSLFDVPYLALLRDVHEKYGTKILANLYFSCPEHGYFDLTMMPDRYKDEFRANADWFRLGFHSSTNDPPHIYLNVDYDTLKNDIENVRREVFRFAGEECWAPPVDTMHWDECSDAGMHAFRDADLRCFCVTSRLHPDGTADLKLQMTDEQAHQSHQYAGLYDPKYDMMYFTCDLYVNEHDPAGVRRALEINQARYPRRGFVELLIHEQYFYPDYVNYLPYYREIVFEAVDWCHKHGYHPDFMRNTLFEDDYVSADS